MLIKENSLRYFAWWLSKSVEWGVNLVVKKTCILILFADPGVSSSNESEGRGGYLASCCFPLIRG